jgi:hypothetical protein
MKYVQPVGAAENAPYLDGNPSTGVEGSPVPAAAIEHPMREIIAVIQAAGLTPNANALNQLLLAIPTVAGGMAVTTTDDPTWANNSALPPSTNWLRGFLTNQMYMLIPAGIFMWWTGQTPPPGYIETNGALLTRTAYPRLWAHAQTNLVTETEWQAGYTGRYSSGTSTANFRIPDTRGEFIRGWDHGRGVDSGRELGRFQADGGRNSYGEFLISLYLPNSDWGAMAEQITSLFTSNGNCMQLRGMGQAVFGTNYAGATLQYVINTSRSWPNNHAVEFRPRSIALLGCIRY